MEKRKRGRPKGSTKKRQLSRPQPDTSQQQAPEVIPPKEGKSLVDHVRNIASKLLPAPGPTIESSQPENPSPGLTPGSVTDGNFAAVAAETREKYAIAVEGDPQQSGNGVAPDGGAAAGSGGPVPQPIAEHFVDPKIVLMLRKMLVKGLAQKNPLRDMSQEQMELYADCDVAMLDEQGPKWLSKLDNPAFWAWLTMNSMWIASTSPRLADAATKLIERIFTMFGGNTGGVQQ